MISFCVDGPGHISLLGSGSQPVVRFTTLKGTYTYIHIPNSGLYPWATHENIKMAKMDPYVLILDTPKSIQLFPKGPLCFGKWRKSGRLVFMGTIKEPSSL
jgi:hypothetical protein